MLRRQEFWSGKRPELCEECGRQLKRMFAQASLKKHDEHTGKRWTEQKVCCMICLLQYQGETYKLYRLDTMECVE